ncbi:MAG TPA: protein kinase, partial [Polyangiaceae bacterium]
MKPITFAQRYDRLEEVNRGGIGRIDAAFDPVLGRRVAIKVLLEGAREDEEAVRKFAEEAQITGQLEHPNMVPIYDLGQDAGGPLIVMKLVSGQTLGQIIQTHRTPGLPEDLQRLLGVVLRL